MTETTFTGPEGATYTPIEWRQITPKASLCVAVNEAGEQAMFWSDGRFMGMMDALRRDGPELQEAIRQVGDAVIDKILDGIFDGILPLQDRLLQPPKGKYHVGGLWPGKGERKA